MPEGVRRHLEASRGALGEGDDAGGGEGAVEMLRFPLSMAAPRTDTDHSGERCTGGKGGRAGVCVHCRGRYWGQGACVQDQEHCGRWGVGSCLGACPAGGCAQDLAALWPPWHCMHSLTSRRTRLPALVQQAVLFPLPHSLLGRSDRYGVQLCHPGPGCQLPPPQDLPLLPRPGLGAAEGGRGGPGRGGAGWAECSPVWAVLSAAQTTSCGRQGGAAAATAGGHYIPWGEPRPQPSLLPGHHAASPAPQHSSLPRLAASHLPCPPLPLPRPSCPAGRAAAKPAVQAAQDAVQG